MIDENKTEGTFVSILNPESKYKIDKLRSIPCYARFAHPAIGLDGYLYHCSESSSPDFHDMSMGNLRDKSFWELYYSYDKETIEKKALNLWKKINACVTENYI